MNELITQAEITSHIFSIRGIEVMLDRDLAELYGVETKRVNEAVRNNQDKFLEDFILSLQIKSLKFCGRNFRPQIFLKQG